MSRPEDLTRTTGSLFMLLEKQKRNPDSRDDLEKIKEFINNNTGFRYGYASIKKNELVIEIKAYAK